MSKSIAVQTEHAVSYQGDCHHDDFTLCDDPSHTDPEIYNMFPCCESAPCGARVKLRMMKIHQRDCLLCLGQAQENGK